MDIKVIALDIDGTLTNSKKEISVRTKEVLHKAMKQGVHVVLASGRPTIGITPLAKELNMKEHGGYILAFNGGKIIDCKTDRIIYENTLPMDCMETLRDVVKQYNVAMLTYRGNEIITEEDNDPYVLKECFINKTKPHKVTNLAKAVTAPVPKCLICGEHERLLPVKQCLEERFKDQLNIFFSEPYFLEIMPLGIEKAASLERLLQILKTDRSHLMACGDGLNDLAMLKFAGLGVAMENACREAKEIADVVTTSNDADGVAVAVEKYILEYEEEVG